MAVRNSLPGANFNAAGKFFTDFPAARNAIRAKVRAFSGKENGSWKIGSAFGNAPGFSPLRPPHLQQGVSGTCFVTPCAR